MCFIQTPNQGHQEKDLVVNIEKEEDQMGQGIGHNARLM
jgi:hypothetical protein